MPLALVAMTMRGKPPPKEKQKGDQMKTRTLLSVLFTLAVFAVAAPAAVAQGIPFETLVVKGSFDLPADKSSPGSLATLVQFALPVSGGGISPSTDQVVFAFQPAQPQLPAVLPAIVVALPGGCLVPHKSGGWALGDGSVHDCGFQLFHLFPDQSRADLTPFVTDAAVRLVEVIATKGWEMKLQIDFSGLDPAGIVGPTMVFATVGNHTGMTNVTAKVEFFGIIAPMF